MGYRSVLVEVVHLRPPGLPPLLVLGRQVTSPWEDCGARDQAHLQKAVDCRPFHHLFAGMAKHASSSPAHAQDVLKIELLFLAAGWPQCWCAQCYGCLPLLSGRHGTTAQGC